MEIPDRCGGGLILEPVPEPIPCGALILPELAGLSPMEANERIDQIIAESTDRCVLGTPDGPGSHRVGELAHGMVELIDGDPFAFAAMNVDLRQCQGGLEGTLTLSVSDGVA